MKKMILLTMLIMSMSTAAVAQDTKASRTAAANRYADTIDVSKMLNDMSLQISKTLPVESREKFMKNTQYTETEASELREMMLEQMINHFTTNELDALAAFYGSAEGKSIIVKMPNYFAAVFPKMQLFILEKHAQ